MEAKQAVSRNRTLWIVAGGLAVAAAAGVVIFYSLAAKEPPVTIGDGSLCMKDSTDAFPLGTNTLVKNLSGAKVYVDQGGPAACNAAATAADCANGCVTFSKAQKVEVEYTVPGVNTPRHIDIDLSSASQVTITSREVPFDDFADAGANRKRVHRTDAAVSKITVDGQTTVDCSKQPGGPQRRCRVVFAN